MNDVPDYDDVPTVEGMEEITPAVEMDEFLSQFLPIFDASLPDVLGETMDVVGGLDLGWTEAEKLWLLRELAVSHIAQLPNLTLVTVPWSQPFFEELAVGIVVGLRGFLLGLVGTPRLPEGQDTIEQQLAEWSDSAVDTLVAWMEGTINE